MALFLSDQSTPEDTHILRILLNKFKNFCENIVYCGESVLFQQVLDLKSKISINLSQSFVKDTEHYSLKGQPPSKVR